jgi:hypothetical protein
MPGSQAYSRLFNGTSRPEIVASYRKTYLGAPGDQGLSSARGGRSAGSLENGLRGSLYTVWPPNRHLHQLSRCRGPGPRRPFSKDPAVLPSGRAQTRVCPEAKRTWDPRDPGKPGVRIITRKCFCARAGRKITDLGLDRKPNYTNRKDLRNNSGDDKKSGTLGQPNSVELKGPRQLLRIRPEIFDFEPGLGLKRGQTKPTYPARCPQTGRQQLRTIMARISACFEDDPKL